MAITGKGLKQLGFVSNIDYRLEDHNVPGGAGQVLTWLSESPQPSVSDVEAAHTTWKTNYDAEIAAKENNLASAKTKLADLGLTTDEVKAAFGI